MAFIERENEILTTIKTLVDLKLDFIIVGGYAVSSLARHRFSVDCDIVLSKKNLEKFQKVLESKGFKKHIESSGFDESYNGMFVNYRKEVIGFPVTIDLLINSLVSRSTGASWSFDYIKKNSIEVNLSGLKTSVRCKVPKKELLIAFKIHSGRKTDIRDIIMLNENVDLKEVLSHLKRGHIDELKNQIKKIFFSLDDKNLVNSLKGIFTITNDVEKEIRNTKKFIEKILKKF